VDRIRHRLEEIRQANNEKWDGEEYTKEHFADIEGFLRGLTVPLQYIYGNFHGGIQLEWDCHESFIMEVVVSYYEGATNVEVLIWDTTDNSDIDIEYIRVTADLRRKSLRVSNMLKQFLC
jgi:hypothetical protein